MASYPEDLKYTKEHEWARIAGAKVTVGITQFAQEQLGDVVYVELPKVGDAIRKGEPFGVVESTKAVSELFAPVSGKVVEINDPLVEHPEAINTDPYEEGWMIRVEGADPKDLEALMNAAAYTKFIAESHE
jgi:glycine cleavage system H protein